jgi:hypothetical protein
MDVESEARFVGLDVDEDEDDDGARPALTSDQILDSTAYHRLQNRPINDNCLRKSCFSSSYSMILAAMRP